MSGGDNGCNLCFNARTLKIYSGLRDCKLQGVSDDVSEMYSLQGEISDKIVPIIARPAINDVPVIFSHSHQMPVLIGVYLSFV